MPDQRKRRPYRTGAATDGAMRLTDVETDQAIVMSHRFHSRKCPPAVNIGAIGVAAYLKFHHVMPAQAIDEVGAAHQAVPPQAVPPARA